MESHSQTEISFPASGIVVAGCTPDNSLLSQLLLGVSGSKCVRDGHVVVAPAQSPLSAVPLDHSHGCQHCSLDDSSLNRLDDNNLDNYNMYACELAKMLGGTVPPFPSPCSATTLLATEAADNDLETSEMDFCKSDNGSNSSGSDPCSYVKLPVGARPFLPDHSSSSELVATDVVRNGFDNFRIHFCKPGSSLDGVLAPFLDPSSSPTLWAVGIVDNHHNDAGIVRCKLDRLHDDIHVYVYIIPAKHPNRRSLRIS